MKTTKQTTKRFPDGFRMVLYIVAVAALGFLSFTVKAAEYEKFSDYLARLEVADMIQIETEIRLEDWMLNFNDEFLAEVNDESIVLEDWMLNFNNETLAEVENEVVLEDWMLAPASFRIPEYMIVEKEEEPVLEDWMLDPGHYINIPLFIAEND